VDVIHLRVPGTLRYRDLAVRVVGAACKLVGSAAGDSGPLRFNNAAIHSYRGETGDVDMEIDVGEDRITIRMRDWGPSFLLDDVPAPDLDALPESGLGLFIIRSFMDDVQYRPGSPNVLSMTKHLDSASRTVVEPADSLDDSAGGKSRQ
jgi:serine/threonine-protein kinase RsbW